MTLGAACPSLNAPSLTMASSNNNSMNKQTKRLPPPLFGNQRSNLSALASSMTLFSSDTLNVKRIDEKSHANERNHVEEAHTFLDMQQDRINSVEEALLKATEDILPMESKCMTITELVQACTSLQRANVELMKRLEERLCREYTGYDSGLTKEKIQACMVDEPTPSLPAGEVTMTPDAWQPTLLEQVVETDNETDTTTTPGSLSFFSPPLSSTSSKPATGDTPVTPSLDNLHLRYVVHFYLLCSIKLLMSHLYSPLI